MIRTRLLRVHFEGRWRKDGEIEEAVIIVQEKVYWRLFFHSVAKQKWLIKWGEMYSETVLSLEAQRVVDVCSLTCSEVYSMSLRDRDPETLPSQGSPLRNASKLTETHEWPSRLNVFEITKVIWIKSEAYRSQLTTLLVLCSLSDSRVKDWSLRITRSKAMNKKVLSEELESGDLRTKTVENNTGRWTVARFKG